MDQGFAETVRSRVITLIRHVNFLPGAPHAVESRIGRTRVPVNLVITRNRKFLYRTVYGSGLDLQVDARDGGVVESAIIFQRPAIMIISN